jgi:hypothetical protein
MEHFVESVRKTLNKILVGMFLAAFAVEKWPLPDLCVGLKDPRQTVLDKDGVTGKWVRFGLAVLAQRTFLAMMISAVIALHAYFAQP